MAIDAGMLAGTLIDAARGVADSEWPDICHVAEAELHRLAQCAADVERLLCERRIDAARARSLFAVYRGAAQTAILTVESLTAAASDAVMQAVLGLIANAIASSVGITLF